jgi:hypothetical protein
MRFRAAERAVTPTTQLRTAYVVAVLTVLLLAVSRILLPVEQWQLTTSSVADLVGSGLLLLAGAAVGLLIVSHRPGNVIGWLLALIALVLAAADFASTWARRPLPGAVWAALLTDPLWYAAVAGGGTLLLLLFPTGQLSSPRLRSVIWAIAVATPVAMVTTALAPGALKDSVGVSNPIGVTGAGAAILKVMNQVAGTVLVVGLIVAAGSLIVRWRRARGVDRQQLKWLTFAATVMVMVLFASSILPHGLYALVASTTAVLIPVAIGAAVLRYRLYDIDRLIHRTLTYGLLTALLGGLYAGLVVLLGQVFGGLTAKPPSWAVAGATLTVAALFQPLRGRIQRAVDRRFNRQRYDAGKTIQAFSARLRDETDLDALSADLLAVVHQTIAPTTASLWLHAPGQRVGRRA